MVRSNHEDKVLVGLTETTDPTTELQQGLLTLLVFAAAVWRQRRHRLIWSHLSPLSLSPASLISSV